MSQLAQGSVTLHAHDEMFRCQGVIVIGMTETVIEEAATAMITKESH